jgi:hypothetical protein
MFRPLGIGKWRLLATNFDGVFREGSKKLHRDSTERVFRTEATRYVGTTGPGAKIHNTSESCDNQGVASAD